jgi:heptosyltransferase-2
MNPSLQTLHPDCRHFKGYIPCKPHKQHGVHCQDCPHYEPTKERILIIKLGAIGDVIRTTPLLHRLNKEYPAGRIYWLTLSPDVLPRQVDHVLRFDAVGVAVVQQTEFDLVLNLDKDPEACALANSVKANTKKGFLLRDSRPWPADADATAKFMTGLFDDLSRANEKSYLQEIFEIAGYTFAGEPYILESGANEEGWTLDPKKGVIGLNTGCGGRWSSRLWADENWVALAKRLLQDGYAVVLLGGEQEHEKNVRLSRLSGAEYFGHFPLRRFIHLVDQCDVVVTAVTMATHIAIGLQKKVILFNNTFNANEFELYGHGEILEPDFDCDCYYAAVCPNNCMQYLHVDTVYEACQRWLIKSKLVLS